MYTHAPTHQKGFANQSSLKSSPRVTEVYDLNFIAAHITRSRQNAAPTTPTLMSLYARERERGKTADGEREEKGRQP